MQTWGTCARICKFPEPKSHTLPIEATTAPDGWWSIPVSKSKLVFSIFSRVRVTGFSFKLRRVQSAKTCVYVLGRIIIAA